MANLISSVLINWLCILIKFLVNQRYFLTGWVCKHVKPISTNSNKPVINLFICSAISLHMTCSIAVLSLIKGKETLVTALMKSLISSRWDRWYLYALVEISKFIFDILRIARCHSVLLRWCFRWFFPFERRTKLHMYC